jgi:hypothetical protein
MRLFTRATRKEKAMAGTVRARVRRGGLEFLEKVDIPEGTEVSVTILETPEERDLDAFRRAAGSWKGTIDVDEFLQNNAESRRCSTRPMPRL